jgi:AcrR family transcriptional regulator
MPDPSAPSHTDVGRPTDAELTRRIHTATLELLVQDGYTQLRLEHVAKRAGCGKPAIYRRYADKPALVAGAALSYLEVGETPDTGDLVTDLVAHARQNQRNQRSADGEQTTRHGLVAMFEPEIFPLLWNDFFRRRRDQGVAILERGIARGELADDADPDVILDTIAGLTLYRQSVKQIDIPVDHYRAVIAALIAHPPRRSGAVDRDEPSS